MMGVEVKFQGDGLNRALEDIEAARDRVKMGESQIADAENKSRNAMRKIILLSIAIFFIVAVIIVIILLLIFGQNS